MKKEVEKKEEKKEPIMAEVSVDILNAVLEFLGAQPYSKVAGLIDAIKENAKVK